MVQDEVKEGIKPKREKPSAAKIGRRLSARVGEMFKAKHKSDVTSPKTEEAPPKIDEPTPVAPLENPAAAGSSKEAATSAPAADEENKTEAPPAIAPVVAATA